MWSYEERVPLFAVCGPIWAILHCGAVAFRVTGPESDAQYIVNLLNERGIEDAEISSCSVV